MLALSIGVVIVAAYVLLHQWGMQPVVEKLEDMRTFNAGVVLLVRRGLSGAALRVEWPDAGVAVLIEKRLDEKAGMSLVVRDISVSPMSTDSTFRIRVDHFIGDRLEEAHTGETVRALRHALEAKAHQHRCAPLRGAVISYQGRVLAFNVPEATGVPSDGRLGA